jgi:hypothetical protein
MSAATDCKLLDPFPVSTDIHLNPARARPPNCNPCGRENLSRMCLQQTRNVASLQDAHGTAMVIWGSAFHCDPQLISANLDGSKPEEIVTVEASPGTYCQVSDRRFRFSTSSHLEAPGDPGQESLSIATAVAHPLLAVQCCLRKTKLSGEEYDAIETLTA